MNVPVVAAVAAYFAVNVFEPGVAPPTKWEYEACMAPVPVFCTAKLVDAVLLPPVYDM